ncbi:hypothetical protein KOI73_22535, partial [Escherichia coli]|nr:hypothetical protein [Escherichia coli]
FIVGGPVGDFELLLCHGTVCVVGKMRDLILQLSKSSIYSTKPLLAGKNRRMLRIIRNARRMAGIFVLRAIYPPGRSLAQA